MRSIPTKVHGYLDYTVAALLIAAPWIIGFNNNATAMAVPILLGVFTILYSLLTDYENGMLPFFSMRVHLTLDLLNGLFLAVSPWLLGFYNEVYLPHLLVGVVEIVVVILSKSVPRIQRNAAHRA